jgi:hypothetical protein
MKLKIRFLKFVLIFSIGLSTFTFAVAGALDFQSPEGVIPLSHNKFLNNPADFQFAIMADRTGEERPEIFQTAVTYMNILRPEFVISVGDNINGYTNDPAEIQNQWKELDSLVAQLEMPFFRIVGNHDLNYPATKSIWSASSGMEYYYFVYKNVLFLCLSTDDPPSVPNEETIKQYHQYQARLEGEKDPGKKIALIKEYLEFSDRNLPSRISEQQIEYFRKVISDHNAVRWTFVLLHKPTWEEPSEMASGFEKIEALLSPRSYTVVAGHQHSYAYLKKNGIDYIRMATTGGGFPLLDRENGFDHVMWVTMTDKGPIMCNLLLDDFLDKEGKK